MEINYKDHVISTSAELDGTSKKWNGIYQIHNENGVLVFNSFVDPLDTEIEALEVAMSAAKDWIDFL